MGKEALKTSPYTLLTIIYPWRNAELVDSVARQKMVVYRYYEPWDLIIAWYVQMELCGGSTIMSCLYSMEAVRSRIMPGICSI